jgi:hypothetical protein
MAEVPPPLLPPVGLHGLPNGYLMVMWRVDGVAHERGPEPKRTRCNQPYDPDRVTFVTLVQVMCWLRHAYCPRCFNLTSDGRLI